MLVQGRVIAPGEKFDSYHEVLLLDEERLVSYGYTNSTGEYRIPPQPRGKYYIVVRIDGFKDYRERVDLFGCGAIVDHFIFMEADEEPIKPVILDFTGEVRETVDVSELKRVFPPNAVAEFERARKDRLRGEPERAQTRLEKLLREYPDFYDAHNVLGSVYLEKKKFREAETQYNKARDLRPNSAAPLVSLGSLYVQEAEASTSGPGDIAVFGDIGIMFDDAKTVLLEAVKIKPDASFAHYLLGIVFLREGQHARSEESLRRALEIEPKLRWARLGLGNLYLKEGKLPEALAEFDAYLAEFKKMANTPEVQQVRGKIAAELARKPK
jgi:tetratricopeptide (TPR) repeat protein